MKRFARRVLCVLVWPVFLVIDVMIALVGAESFSMARDFSNREVREVWNR